MKTNLVEEQLFAGTEEETENPFRYFVGDEEKRSHRFESVKPKYFAQEEDDEYVFHPPEPSKSTSLFSFVNRRAKRQVFNRRNDFHPTIVKDDDKMIAGVSNLNFILN